MSTAPNYFRSLWGLIVPAIDLSDWMPAPIKKWTKTS
jgi:hypothetical protein